MPKIRAKGISDPYLEFLTNRQYGVKKHGVQERLFKNLADDLLRSHPLKESKKYRQYFEHSENPTYPVTKYTRNKEGKGVFLKENVPLSIPGGIFNLEFNSDGNILAAACEKKSILIFDPLRRNLVHSLNNAHTDCVNCIRFLDSRTFASCSDDTSVVLWDVRNLKSRVRTLRGHSNWVKNIEYNTREGLLVTSGFDGAIYTWDINKYQERQAEYKRVFHTNGLMRMRLTTGCDKMVISTMNGYLMVVHDLDLEMLGQDLAGFKPNMYRMMQTSGKPIEMAVHYTKLFHAKRNRVELISDFPEGNEAECLSSLRLHPQGWVAVSRNTSSDESSEWCTVHDIQTVLTRPEDDIPISGTSPLTWSSVRSASIPSLQQVENDPTAQRFRAGNIEIISTGMREEAVSRPVITIDLNVRRRARALVQQERREDAEDILEGVGVEVDNNEEEANGEEMEVDGQNFLTANSLPALDVLSRIRSVNNSNEPAGRDSGEREGDAGAGPSNPPPNRGSGSYLIIGPGSRARARLLYFGSPGAHRAQMQRIPKDAKIRKNIPRLTHYIEESNTGKGFIKEQSFSPCGRFLASPFGYGVRLLGFSERGSDLSDCPPTQPQLLHELGTKLGHNDVVLSTAFSPHHWLLATGCLSGRISWHQPLL